jgi:hypothetical protein
MQKQQIMSTARCTGEQKKYLFLRISKIFRYASVKQKKEILLY